MKKKSGHEVRDLEEHDRHWKSQKKISKSKNGQKDQILAKREIWRLPFTQNPAHEILQQLQWITAAN